MASRGDIDISTVQPKLFSKWKKLNIEETLDKAGLFTKLKSSQYFDNGQFPVIDQGDKFISGYVNDEKLLYKGGLPVIIFGDHTRNIKFIDFPFAAGADGTKILKPLGIYNPKFYHYYLKSLQVPNLGYSRHFSILKEIEFPLPPLTEQNRIVAKLDSLFAQLETIKISMAKIPVLLKNFRQQVLTQAVTGKLTEEWREGKDLESIEKNFHKNPKGDLLKFIKEFGLNVIVDDSNWVETNFFNLCVLKRGFDLPSYKRDTDGKYPIASSSGVKSFHTDFNAENGIVVGRSGSVGKVFYIKEKFWPLNTTLYSENFNNNYPKYVYYFFLTFNFEYYSSSTAVPTLNRNNFITEEIRIPPLEEQKEIVSRVESLFSKADAIEEKYKNLKAKIETLPQTILHKAFKGELTEQLEADADGDAGGDFSVEEW